MSVAGDIIDELKIDRRAKFGALVGGFCMMAMGVFYLSIAFGDPVGSDERSVQTTSNLLLNDLYAP